MDDLLFTLVLGGLAAATATLWGLVCLWVARGRGRWYVRCGAATALLGLTVPLRAGDLLIVLFTQAVVVVGALRVMKSWPFLLGASKETRVQTVDMVRPSLWQRVQFRFGLLDLMAAVSLVAVWFALVASVGQLRTMPLYMSLGVVLGLMSFAGWETGTASRVWGGWFTWLLCVLYGGTAIIPLALLALFLYSFKLEGLFWSLDISVVPWLTGWSVVPLAVSAVTAAVVHLSLHLGFFSTPTPGTAKVYVSTSASRRRAEGALLALLLLFVILPPALAYWRLLNPLQPTSTPTRDAQAFEDILRAGAMLEANISRDTIVSQPTVVLRDFVESHAEGLRLAHETLAKPVRRTLSLSMHDLGQFGPIRQVADALHIEAELAQREGRTEDAYRSLVAMHQLAWVMKDGGVAVDWLVGNAIESIAQWQFGRTCDDFSAAQLEQLIAFLDAYDNARPPQDEMFLRERAWSEHTSESWPELLIFIVREATIGENPLYPPMQQAADRSVAVTRLLAAQAAVRLFELRHGHIPRSLDDLVPDILGEGPVDPFSGQPLVYRITDEGYVLYSVGPNGVDDGGQPTDWQAGDCDLDLASVFGQSPASAVRGGADEDDGAAESDGDDDPSDDDVAEPDDVAL